VLEAAKGQPDLDVVVPALDEQDRLPATLAALTSYLEATGLTCVVTIVDNGSSDGTADVARGWAATTSVPVRLLSCPQRGKGAAVRTGMLASRARWVGYMDADLATSLEATAAVLDELRDGADVVVGSRRMVRHGVVLTQEPVRQLGGWAFRTASRLVVPTLPDTQCGFKFFAGHRVAALFGPLRSAGWSFDVEVLARARRSGLDVREVPVEWTHDPRSRFRLVRDGVTTFADLVRIRRTLRREGSASAPQDAVSAPATVL
jgi:dolichyl-phosphate beta-glucosyltransferase